tara:strand:- start:93 stop:314 length:222 start_codon:yes stop_codon:yes gene_type:complete
MTDPELKAIDNLVVGLRKMSQAIYLTCDAKVAADVCLKTSQACELIKLLTQQNIVLKYDSDIQKQLSKNTGEK